MAQSVLPSAIDQPLYYSNALGELESPIVRAALQLATKLHEGQWRRKSFVHLPYISHPILAMNILRSYGVNDPHVLASALLHDTLEDCAVPLLKYAMDAQHYDPYAMDIYFSTGHVTFDALSPDKQIECAKEMTLDTKADALAGWLEESVRNEYLTSGYAQATANYMATNAAGQIVDIVKELTNKSPEEAQLDDKRFFQADKTRTYSREAKRVKMAEMCASLADDIMHESNMNSDKLVRMYNRCWTMAKSCADAMPALFQLLRGLDDVAVSVARDPSLRQPAERFKLDDYRDLYPLVYQLSGTNRASEWVDNDVVDENGKPHFQNITSGLLSVGLNENKQVVCFRVLCNRADTNHLDADDPVNDTALALIDKLEELDKPEDKIRNLVSISRMKVYHNVRYGRKMEMITPVPVEEFIADAVAADAIDEAFANKLRAVVQQTPDNLASNIARDATVAPVSPQPTPIPKR